MPGVAYGYAMHGRQFPDVAIVLYSRSGWPDDLVTCDVTGGRYLLMIIDYSVLLVSIVMVGYSGTFLFTFFLFSSFLLAVSRIRGVWVSANWNGISFVWSLRCQTTFELCAASWAKSVESSVCRQIWMRFRKARIAANISFFFIY